MSSPSDFAKSEILFKLLDDLPKGKPYTHDEIMDAMKILFKMVHAQSDAYGGKNSKLLPAGIAERITFKQYLSLLSEITNYQENTLLEILDKPFDYELKNIGKKYWLGNFKDDSNEMVIVDFEYWAGPETYIIDFKRKGTYKLTNDSPENKNQGIRIMGTIIEIIKDFLNKQVEPIKFIAYEVNKTEESRNSLYGRLFKRLGSSIGYKIIQDISKVNHSVFPTWWENKMKYSKKNYSFVILAHKDIDIGE